ncbi:8240_t:CDS:2 [Ambispora gerdemannii]|uniref:8240_t:CDS:1 n=1 Tax=Ambispora gerdemannii TaxID=144530 RepID=A0A9N9F8B0_9GLOM|nr:8240_t:CDS:2 [Ambispora gerdemannii]
MEPESESLESLLEEKECIIEENVTNHPWTNSLNKLLEISEKLAPPETDQHPGVLVHTDSNLLESLLFYFPMMDDTTQLVVLEHFTRFAEYNDMNKWILFKANTTSTLLKTLKKLTQSNTITTTAVVDHNHSFVVEKILKLIEIVCSFSVKVSDVKLILNLICLTNEEPKSVESGLVLPTIEKFPMNGYSFFTWFKMDSAKPYHDLSSSDTSDNSKRKDNENNDAPRLFSFFNKSGNGIEAFFMNKELHFFSRKGKEVVHRATMNNLKFLLNRWYFITFVHYPSKRGWTSSPAEIKVTVDAEIEWKAKFDYPVSFPGESFANCVIGASSVDWRHNHQKFEIDTKNNTTDKKTAEFKSSSSYHLQNSFCGQMTTIYLISDVLSQDKINYIHSLGRNHTIEFPTAHTDISQILPSRHMINGKILFRFHVKASENEKCFNLAPRNNYHAPFQFATLVSVQKCSTLSLQNAIRSLGDIEVLFPMIQRFNYLDSITHQAPFESQDDFFASESPCRSFFALITALLQTNYKSQAHIIKSRGIRVISLLLQRIGPRYLTITAFQSIVTLANILSGNEELTLENFCDSRKQMCRVYFGVQYFLDSLQTIYWYEQTEKSASHRHIDGATRPKPPQIKELRAIVLNIIRGYIINDITKDETVCILRNLSVSEDDAHLIEILHGCSSGNNNNNHKDLVENIASYGGFEILCELLKRRREETVRLYCIKIITFLITCPTTPPQFAKKLRFMDTDPSNLVKLLTGVPLTRPIYEALLEWAMETFTLNGLPQENKLQSNIVNQSELQPSTIKNFRVIFVIFSLLNCEGTNPTLQNKILEEFVGFFKHNVDYCLQLNHLWCWQRLLVSRIPPYASIQVNSPQKETANWVIDLLTSIIWNLLPVEKSGFRAIEETIFVLWTSDRANCLEIVRAFLSVMLCVLAKDIRDADLVNFGIIKLENVVRLVMLTEEIIFNHKDIAQVVEQDMSSNEHNTSLSTSYSSSFRSMYENGLPALNALGINDMPVFQKLESTLPSSFNSMLRSDDIVFQSASNPWEENQLLAETYLEIVNALDRKAGWRLETIPPNRIDLRPGDTCRMVLRILIAGISTPDQVLREKALENLVGFIERHVLTPDTASARKQLQEYFCTDSDIFRQHINMLIGEIHEAFM